MVRLSSVLSRSPALLGPPRPSPGEPRPPRAPPPAAKRIRPIATFLEALPIGDWPEMSRREITAHLLILGLSPGTHDPVRSIRAKEIEEGRKRDSARCARGAPGDAAEPRVTAVDMDAMIARARQAEHVAPVPQAALFGFTRLIDAKLELSSDLIRRLAEDALRRRGDRRAPDALLLRAIDRGPRSGDIVWTRPTSKHEVVASLIRQLVLGEGASVRILLSPHLARWFETIAGEQERPPKEALGGAGAFCANVASLLPGVDSRFYSFENVPGRIRRRLSDRVRVLGPPPRNGDRNASARINYALQHDRGLALSILGRDRLTIDGEERLLLTTDSGRIILGSSGRERATFGDLSRASLAQIARDHDVLFLSGMHYHTADPSGECAESLKLRDQLDTMRAAHPALRIHFEYAVPRSEANEARMLSILAGRFDSFSLNSVEIEGVISRLAKANLIDGAGARGSPEERELAANMLEGAERLRGALGLSRIHVHGRYGDLLIQEGVRDPKRQVLALLRARQLASMKSANPSGELCHPTDIWPLHPIVLGAGLAELYAFADAMAERFHLDAAEHRLIVERCWFRHEESDRTYFFVPNRGIHEKAGGTVSAGDTIDSAALLLGLEKRSRSKRRGLRASSEAISNDSAAGNAAAVTQSQRARLSPVRGSRDAPDSERGPRSRASSPPRSVPRRASRSRD